MPKVTLAGPSDGAVPQGHDPEPGSEQALAEYQAASNELHEAEPELETLAGPRPAPVRLGEDVAANPGA